MKLVQFGIKSQDKAGLSARIELIKPAWEEPGKQREISTSSSSALADLDNYRGLMSLGPILFLRLGSFKRSKPTTSSTAGIKS